MPVGALPDMLTFTPNGRQLLVANEATPNPRPTARRPERRRSGGQRQHHRRASRAASRHCRSTRRSPATTTLRLFPATGSAADAARHLQRLRPRAGVHRRRQDGKYAYVGAAGGQRHRRAEPADTRFEKIYSLGLKDFSLPGNEIDPNDRDGGIAAAQRAPSKGLYQPDTIAAYEHRGRTYLVMANEGDARDNGSADGEDERRGSAGSASIEYVPEGTELGRLTLSNVDSARGGPLVKFGGHSFSIRDTDGSIVFDSGSQLDREAIRLGIYDDGRSDNKGVEPEGVALLHDRGPHAGLHRPRAHAQVGDRRLRHHRPAERPDTST